MHFFFSTLPPDKGSTFTKPQAVWLAITHMALIQHVMTKKLSRALLARHKAAPLCRSLHTLLPNEQKPPDPSSSSPSPLHLSPASQSLSRVWRSFSSSTTTAVSTEEYPNAHHPEAAEYLKRSSVAVEEDDKDPFFDKTSALMEVEDRPGALAEMLSYFAAHHVNITRLESRPSKKHYDDQGQGRLVFDMYVDFEGSRGIARVDALLQELGEHSRSLLVLDRTEVPWFPRQAWQLDTIANRVLDAGVDLTSDHPGFSDPVYRARRGELAQIARQYRHGETIPHIAYTPAETATWSAVFRRQDELLRRYACREYLDILALMKEECGYGPESIPQQADITRFLARRTDFRLRPVAGLLSSRDFLNGLAFRVFFCTQYIRHHSRPLYTPEPDICHELLGHAPLFADPDFADFSNEIGLASLGASDEEVKKLAACYWHSVEFGLCRQHAAGTELSQEQGNGTASSIKAYGAGLLSSFGELEYACGGEEGKEGGPTFLPWDPEVAAVQSYPITTYQPVYFVAESLLDAKEKMRKYCEKKMSRPFYARYMPEVQSIWVDRAVRVGKKVG